MKYSHSSKYRKTCPHDPDTRAQLGQRLRYARLKLGWSIEAAGKYFQVTDRTWHNWETGSHRIPFAVYKLARILARLELPSEAWAGWRLEGSVLITPEGRQITPQDGSWWSLLVRQAAGFRSVYAEANRLRLELGQVMAASATVERQAQRADGGEAHGDVGEVAADSPRSVTRGERNTKSDKKTSDSSQNDVIMNSWPIPSDSPTPLTHLHAPRPTISASASTPSFALPWMPTCAIRVTLLRPEQSQQRSLKSQLPSLPKSPLLRPAQRQQRSLKSQLPSLPKSPLLPNPASLAGANDSASAIQPFADLAQSTQSGGAA